MIVTLCGSTKFMDSFHRANVELTKRGLSVFSVAMSSQGDFAPNPTEKTILDLVHLDKILTADAVFVVGEGLGPNASLYIGKSTAREIVWADMHRKPIVAMALRHDWDDAAQRLKYQAWDSRIVARAMNVLRELKEAM